MLLYTFCFGPLGTNALLLGCPTEKKAAVIDPSQGSCEALLSKAKQLGLSIEKILLTHSHWDHFADLPQIKKKTSAPVYVHFLDAKNIEHPGSDGLPLFFPIEPTKVDHFLKEEEPIFIGKMRLEIIHTPGHSPGSVCFYIKEEKLLISGDTLFQGSIGNLSLPTAKPEEMWGSLDKLAKLPKETRVVPGHGEETTIGQEHWLERAKQIFSE